MAEKHASDSGESNAGSGSREEDRDHGAASGDQRLFQSASPNFHSTDPEMARYFEPLPESGEKAEAGECDPRPRQVVTLPRHRAESGLVGHERADFLAHYAPPLIADHAGTQVFRSL